MRAKNKNGIKGQKNRKHKINLVFDEAKRREFLTGFHKRKLQRKKNAKEALELELKEERKRLKSEAKESFKKLVVSHRPIPELETLLNEEYDDEDVTVKVVELSTNAIAKTNNWIGANQPKYDIDNKEDKEDSEPEEIPGMELKTKPVKLKKEAEKRTFESEKQLKKTLKKQATQKVKQSKVFQRKNKMERVKQLKKSRKATHQEQGKETRRKGHTNRQTNRRKK